MELSVVNSLLAVFALAASAQWLAWVLRLPAILLLLLFGFLAGPVTQTIRPDELFGGLLLPIVSLSVALILFEGGLGLNFRDLRGVGAVVRNLVTVGAVVTWAVAGLAAYFIVGLDAPLAVLLGAILSVTGPTVVLPLLDYVKPKGRVGPVLKWEGIVIDPIGALLAVGVFEAVLSGRMEQAPINLGLALGRSLLAGGGLGLLASMLLVFLIRRHLVPDPLQTIVAMALVLGAFGIANMVQAESGLAAVTVMGVALANQRRVDVRRIMEFKEDLRVLLLSSVFILLSARLNLEDLKRMGGDTVLFIAALVFIARPLCVAAATAGSPLNWRERVFLMWMAPRGIVAAAVASVFSLALEQAGYRQARLLLPITFGSIVGTVVLYGLTVSYAGRRLGLSERNPQGLLIAGANRFARELAAVVQGAGFRTLLVDTNRANVAEAQTARVPAFQASILSEDLAERVDLTGIGRLLALTANDEVNLLAVERFSRTFGRNAVFQLTPKAELGGQPSLKLRSPTLFHHEATYEAIERWLEEGAAVKATKLTEDFNFDAFRRHYGDRAILLFIEDRGKLLVVTTGQKMTPRPGQTVFSLVRAPAGEEVVGSDAAAVGGG